MLAWVWAVAQDVDSKSVALSKAERRIEELEAELSTQRARADASDSKCCSLERQLNDMAAEREKLLRELGLLKEASSSSQSALGKQLEDAKAEIERLKLQYDKELQELRSSRARPQN